MRLQTALPSSVKWILTCLTFRPLTHTQAHRNRSLFIYKCTKSLAAEMSISPGQRILSVPQWFHLVVQEFANLVERELKKPETPQGVAALGFRWVLAWFSRSGSSLQSWVETRSTWLLDPAICSPSLTFFTVQIQSLVKGVADSLASIPLLRNKDFMTGGEPLLHQGHGGDVINTSGARTLFPVFVFVLQYRPYDSPHYPASESWLPVELQCREGLSYNPFCYTTPAKLLVKRN